MKTDTPEIPPPFSGDKPRSYKKLLALAVGKALFFAVAAYPAIVVICSMVSLFQNRSFSFLGYELSVVLTEHSASAGLKINPEFFVSILVLFVISTLVIWGVEALLLARKGQA